MADLNPNRDLLALVVDATPSGMIMVDSSGKIAIVNMQIEKLFGYHRQELLGEPIEILVPEAARSGHAALRDSYMAAPLARNMGSGRDLHGRRKDGSLIPVEIGLNPLTAGGEQYVLASVVDISERKRHEERLALVVEAAPSGMVMVDRTGRIILVNSHIEKLFGYAREKLLGKPIETLIPRNYRDKHPAQRDAYFQAPSTRAMGVGRDLFGLHKNGSEIPVEIGLNPISMEDEEFVLASVVDITERKIAERIIHDKVLELERSNRDLQQFAYVCSHDLQEPLRVISNYTQLISRRYAGRLDEDADEFIEFIVSASRRMQGLINDLLAYSRVETRGKPFTTVNTNKAVEAAAANLKLAIEEAGAKIDCRPLPSVTGDETQLLQLFQNLLSNAIKFRSKAPPRIEIAGIRSGSRVTFTVSDNGIGIDAKHADRIFVIFQRLHTREDYEGSGIGLAICKRIVERHGGFIKVEPETGGGSEFIFSLPMAGESQ